jgi:predicted RNase H-like HicB family nuclease
MKKMQPIKDEFYQNIQFFLTLAWTKDDETGDYTAYYVQFPEACAQGRNKAEAVKLLDEIFPYLLEKKKQEFIKYHSSHSNSVTKYEDREMTAA